MGALYVCNNGEKEFADRYDGEDYVFPIGMTVALPVMAAKHIFGYGESDKTRALKRQGVMNYSTDKPKAMEWLGQFKFEELEPPAPPDLSSKRPLSRGARHIDDDNLPPSGPKRQDPVPARV